jgi:hypothetical protein
MLKGFGLVAWMGMRRSPINLSQQKKSDRRQYLEPREISLGDGENRDRSQTMTIKLG